MNNKINFTLTQIEYVIALNKYGHFAKAAEACHITQPTLSMQIQKLEEELGVVIFDRSKKPILVTDMGRKVLEQFQAIWLEAKKISGLVQTDETEKMKGELTLGVIPTVAPYLLPLILPEVERRYPKLSLKILELQTHRIIESLSEDEIDVGLLATPLKIPKIFEHPLFYEPFSVLCRQDHELARLKKAKYSLLKFSELWLLEEGHCLRNQVLDVCAVKKNSQQKKKFNFESGSLETLKNLVSGYGGYTLLPALAENNLSPNTTIIPFERPVPAREIGLVYRREHFKIDLIEGLADVIVNVIPESIRKIRQKDLDVLPI